VVEIFVACEDELKAMMTRLLFIIVKASNRDMSTVLEYNLIAVVMLLVNILVVAIMLLRVI
jgi:hypothetical protein